MNRKFKIEIILTVISGINLTDDFNDVYELYWYVFDDEYINESGLRILNKSLCDHLIKSYPELSRAKRNVYSSLWLLRDKYGEELEVSKINNPSYGESFNDMELLSKINVNFNKKVSK